MQINIFLRDGTPKSYIAKELIETDPEELRVVEDTGLFSVFRKDMISYYEVRPLE